MPYPIYTSNFFFLKLCVNCNLNILQVLVAFQNVTQACILTSFRKHLHDRSDDLW